MSSSLKPMTASEIEEWLTGSMVGKPEEARAFAEQHLSPKFWRQMAHGDTTDFERAVEKITQFRGTTQMWESPVRMIVQNGNQVSARVDIKMQMEGQPEFEGELMLMAIRDEQGRIEQLWELMMPLKQG